ncbi:ATP-dependent DNA helicase RecG [Arsukibacterium sp. MJ3]|uniref:ATP-dependent DNA helicase RecG n=1 Tax=Arsukibacterium sp. MJ3 TaxID=1632859 RepID=UPI000627407A|nr:ATP-dependent DNA helicase RecG [Arsukibacterium sp. MJ3]KKO49082.1 ATP-dependent DNA helicase RecG [Arsukibacterium sp. MJ3]
MPQTRLDSLSISLIKGVGAKVAQRLEKLGIASIQDLLFHLPLRYEDRTRIYPIADLMPSIHATVQATVVSSDIQFGKRRSWLVKVSDGSGFLTCRFFHFNAAQKNAVSPGVILRLFGEVKRGSRGVEMLHPEYRLQQDEQLQSVAETLTPVYPTTEGIKQATWRKLSDAALDYLQRYTPVEYLPATLLSSPWSLAEALCYIHRPPPDAQLSLLEQGRHPAQQRLIIEELVAQQLSMFQLRSQSQQHQAIALKHDPVVEQTFLARLPFSLTGAQLRVVAELRQDLANTLPMLRLVQGDVGSGKTLVAALAALTAIGQGYQVALMAPTELLAEQHVVNFNKWFQPLNISVVWLGGKTKGKARNEVLHQLADGSAQMVVGTHALFQQSVSFNRLALIIIDEQHRFGVQQRLALREKSGMPGIYPHQLVMTATPIPRTLAMTAYADLDTSIIDELPPGRTPVTTVAIPDTRRDDIIQRVRNGVVQDKRQVYWVCTLIEESEVLQCQAAEDTAASLAIALPELNIALVHGRLKSAEKQDIMARFSQGELDLLVATTVIEVGVDVPNASLMIIENPERLGLAQLHQLRGRVGRGNTASHCVLLYHAPLSKTAQARLSVLRDSNDGFVIAQRDLEIRGPGELLGTRQTGLLQFKIADISRDAELIPHARQLAATLWQQGQQQQDHTACLQLIRRWLANKEIYGNA